jgi:hypothetical protein
MKKTLTFFFVVASIHLSAQTTKGSFMIGGDGSLSFDHNYVDDQDNNSKSATFSLNPAVGYFFIKNLSVGLSLPFSLSRAKWLVNDIEFRGKGYSIGVTPMVRYYIPIKKFFVVTQGTVGWTYSKDKYEATDVISGIMSKSENTTKWKGFGLAAGPAFFLNPYTSIEVLANYRFLNDPNYNRSSWYFSLGFQIYLPKLKV